MRKTKHRIIVDTNLWVSFLLTKDFSKMDSVFDANKTTLLFSQELLDEFVEVAERPKFKKYFSPADLQDLLTKIRTKAEFVLVTSTADLCRDPKDNFLLALATDGKATHLITGDKDLLVLERFAMTKIINITTYLVDL